MSDHMVKIGALWKKNKDGKDFLSGLTEKGTRILVFKNGYKTKESHPDYILYSTGESRAQQEQPEPKQRAYVPPPEDEVPF